MCTYFTTWSDLHGAYLLLWHIYGFMVHPHHHPCPSKSYMTNWAFNLSLSSLCLSLSFSVSLSLPLSLTHSIQFLFCSCWSLCLSACIVNVSVFRSWVDIVGILVRAGLVCVLGTYVSWNGAILNELGQLVTRLKARLDCHFSKLAFDLVLVWPVTQCKNLNLVLVWPVSQCKNLKAQDLGLPCTNVNLL